MAAPAYTMTCARAALAHGVFQFWLMMPLASLREMKWAELDRNPSRLQPLARALLILIVVARLIWRLDASRVALPTTLRDPTVFRTRDATGTSTPS